MRVPLRPIRDYMTACPHSVAHDRALNTAHRLMRKYRIRHLPVLKAGKVVGLLSERDLHLVETLKDVDPASVMVEEAMSPDPFVVSPMTPLDRVVGIMAKRKVGSAVIADGDRLAGIFTTTDALRVLQSLLVEPSSRPESPEPQPPPESPQPEPPAALTT